jgi:hypothetical protein
MPFQMIAFDGLREVPSGGNPSRFVTFHDDPGIQTAQEAETAGYVYWPTVKAGVFGQTGGTSADRTVGWVVGIATAVLAIGTLVATVTLRGER